MWRNIAIPGLSLAAFLVTAFMILTVWAYLTPVPAFYAGLHMADPQLGWVLRPSLRGEGETFTDDHGARVSDPTTLHPIAVGLVSVGDSQTFGAGVFASETFTAVAGRLTGLTTANYGVFSYSGVNSLLMLRRHLTDHPRFIVYGFWFEHLTRNLLPCAETGTYFCIERPVVRVMEGMPSIEFPHGPARWWRPGRWRAADHFLAPLAFIQLTFRRTFISPANQQIAAEYVLRQMEDSAQSVGARLIVAWIPSYFHGIAPMPSWLTDLARSAGFALIDTGPSLARLRSEGQDIYLLNGRYAGHLAVIAHREIGAEIASAITVLERRAQQIPEHLAIHADDLWQQTVGRNPVASRGPSTPPSP